MNLNKWIALARETGFARFLLVGGLMVFAFGLILAFMGADDMAFAVGCLAVGLAAVAGGVVMIVKAVKKQQALDQQEEEWKNGN